MTMPLPDAALTPKPVRQTVKMAKPWALAMIDGGILATTFCCFLCELTSPEADSKTSVRLSADDEHLIRGKTRGLTGESPQNPATLFAFPARPSDQPKRALGNAAHLGMSTCGSLQLGVTEDCAERTGQKPSTPHLPAVLFIHSPAGASFFHPQSV
jgi:hypothetical protein